MRHCARQQTDIGANLACLPLFLSGCRKVVVLAGESYTSRLWCVMELFAFVHMGGDLGDVEVLEAHAPGGAQRVADSFANFDAAEANCYDPKDKAHMLRVIEAAFGDMRSFNGVVRPLMRHFDTLRRTRATSLQRGGSELSRGGSELSVCEELPAAPLLREGSARRSDHGAVELVEIAVEKM